MQIIFRLSLLWLSLNSIHSKKLQITTFMLQLGLKVKHFQRLTISYQKIHTLGKKTTKYKHFLHSYVNLHYSYSNYLYRIISTTSSFLFSITLTLFTCSCLNKDGIFHCLFKYGIPFAHKNITISSCRLFILFLKCHYFHYFSISERNIFPSHNFILHTSLLVLISVGGFSNDSWEKKRRNYT